MSAEDDIKRRRACEAFADRLELPPIARLVQRGRDPHAAVFTIEFADGRKLRVGTIKTLWSQTEFAKVIAVALATVPFSVDAADWRKYNRAMLKFATDVVETPGEGFEDTVREWVCAYAGNASIDRNGAAAGGMPFVEEGVLHVQAAGLAKFVRRELLEQVKLSELYQGLRDLGFERRVIHYVRDTRKNTTSRSTASYYRAPLDALDIGIGVG